MNILAPDCRSRLLFLAGEDTLVLNKLCGVYDSTEGKLHVCIIFLGG